MDEITLTLPAGLLRDMLYYIEDCINALELRSTFQGSGHAVLLPSEEDQATLAMLYVAEKKLTKALGENND